MGIYATWLGITDDEHEFSCATWEKTTKSKAHASGRMGLTTSGHYYMPSGNPCDCKDKAPIVYQGSHINPDYDDPRGGYVYVCAIPNHCHPSVRGQMTDDGPPVDYLRLSVGEDATTYGGRQLGDATVVLDKRQVKKLHKTLGAWLKADERA